MQMQYVFYEVGTEHLDKFDYPRTSNCELCDKSGRSDKGGTFVTCVHRAVPGGSGAGPL